MDERRMVAVLKEFGTDRIVVNSAADWGRSDPLKTLRVAEAMLAAGFDDGDVDKVLWQNPVAFYAQSGRLELSDEDSATNSTALNADAANADAMNTNAMDATAMNTAATYAGSSVRRGEPKE